MVFSHLNKKIDYLENPEIDPEDKDYEAGIYEIELFSKKYWIALGKVKYTFSLNYGILYLPMYLIHEKKIKGKIGVFEIEETRMPSLIDPNDHYAKADILGEPLFFSRITKEYLENANVSSMEEENIPEKDTLKPKNKNINPKKKKELEEGEIDEEEEENESEEEEEDEVFSLQKQSEKEVPKNKEEKRMTISDVFVKDKTPPSNATWPTETESDAKKYRKEYNGHKSINDNWVIQFMKNKQYNILKNNGGGDCLFYTIRDAFEEIGMHTTIQKLRLILSQEATINELEQFTKLYKDIEENHNRIEHEMYIIAQSNASLKKQSQQIQNQPEMNKERMKSLLESAKELQKEHQKLKLEKESSEELLQEFQFMEHIKTITDFRTFIRTSSYWADTWAISVLERLLELKIIVLEDSTDKDAVMRCGQLNEEITAFTPKYYILVNYSGKNHFELITYKDKRIFTFQEIPYDIKILITNKCMEKMAGPYAIIPAFKEFHSELGIKIPEKEELEKKIEQTDLFEEDVIFTFHSKSDSSKKPGKGIGEKIPETRVPEFEILIRKDTKTKTMIPWRQQLDDSWTGAVFTIDHIRWNSIAHFLLALRFEKAEPKIYKIFSLDSDSEISKDLEKAKESIEKGKGKSMEQGKYYTLWKGLEKISEEDERTARKEALFAKFTQNADLTTMLLQTKMAKLMHFQRGKDLEEDILLMTIRKKIASSPV
jgi:hypothetical protein